MPSLNKGYTKLIIETCKKHSLLRNQAAYVLATAYWETGRTMRPVEEAYHLQKKYNWSDARMDRWRKRNFRYYPWHGRGFVQLTWERNYKHAARKLGIAFDKDPTLAFEPEPAVEVLVLGMKEGWFTTRRLSQYITLRKSDFYNARRIVNGMDKASQIASLAKQYDKALLDLGYGVDTDTTPDVEQPVETPAEAVPVPVVPEGLDKDLPKSKTLWSMFLSLISSGALTMFTDWRVQIVLLAVIAAGGFMIWRERKKYRDKAREMFDSFDPAIEDVDSEVVS